MATKAPAKRSNTKSSAKVGGIKSPISMKTGLIVVATIMLLGAIVSVAYGQLHVHNLKAHAAGWTLLSSKCAPDSSGTCELVQVRACKTYVASAYGPLWKVNVLYGTPASSTTVNLSINRYTNGVGPASIGSQSSRSWYGGVILLTEYMSASNPPYRDVLASTMSGMYGTPRLVTLLNEVPASAIKATC